MKRIKIIDATQRSIRAFLDTGSVTDLLNATGFRVPHWPSPCPRDLVTTHSTFTVSLPFTWFLTHCYISYFSLILSLPIIPFSFFRSRMYPPSSLRQLYRTTKQSSFAPRCKENKSAESDTAHAVSRERLVRWPAERRRRLDLKRGGRVNDGRRDWPEDSLDREHSCLFAKSTN